MTNEERRADDLRLATCREREIPAAPWRMLTAAEQSHWRRIARAQSINGTAVATAPKRSGFTPASDSQRESIRTRGSVVSGKGPCEPAHLCPRAEGGCGDPLCTVPLTREEHRAFDDGKLDILGALVANGYWAEMAHMVEAHHLSPLDVIQRLTGVRWAPERQVTSGPFGRPEEEARWNSHKQ